MRMDDITRSMRFLAQSVGDLAAGLPDADSVRFLRGCFVVNRNNVNQGGLGGGVFNKIAFNNVVVDSDSWFDATTNFRYTPQLPGFYLFHVAVNGTYAAATDSVRAAIFKNGGNVASGIYLGGSAAANTGSTSSVTDMVLMNGTTDFVEGFSYIPA